MNARLADQLFQDEQDHSAQSRVAIPDPGIRVGLLEVGQLDVLRKRHAFLNEYPDSMLVNTPIETLLKLESTSIKLKNLERAKDAEDKLAFNREALMTTEFKVKQGVDNRWSILHEARFLPGAACSSAKLWLKAREVLGSNIQAPVSVYDMASVGLAGHVTPRGWLALGDPGNSSISINMFSINNCGKKLGGKTDGLKEDQLKEIVETGELRTAVRALREALSFAQPWNRSVAALEGFLLQNNFCSADLEGVDQQAAILVSFVDYVLRENSNRWRGQEAFLSISELKGTWESFYGSRPQSMLVRSKRQSQFHQKGHSKGYGQFHGASLQSSQAVIGQVQVKQEFSQGNRPYIPQALFWDDICVMYNVGRCVKPPGTCITKRGRPLRHICNHRADPAKPAEYCGQTHAACFNH